MRASERMAAVEAVVFIWRAYSMGEMNNPLA